MKIFKICLSLLLALSLSCSTVHQTKQEYCKDKARYLLIQKPDNSIWGKMPATAIHQKTFQKCMEQ